MGMERFHEALEEFRRAEALDANNTELAIGKRIKTKNAFKAADDKAGLEPYMRADAVAFMSDGKIAEAAVVWGELARYQLLPDYISLSFELSNGFINRSLLHTLTT